MRCLIVARCVDPSYWTKVHPGFTGVIRYKRKRLTKYSGRGEHFLWVDYPQTALVVIYSYVQFRKTGF